MLDMMADLLLLFGLPGLFLIAGIFDVLTGRIPDWIILALLALFVVFSTLSGWSLTLIVEHFGTALLVFLAGFVAFYFGLAGGGDGKLAAAGALWFGPTAVLSFLTLSFIFGGVLVGLAFVLRTVWLPEIVIRQAWIQRWIVGKDGLPFGLAMAAAVLVLRQIGFDSPA